MDENMFFSQLMELLKEENDRKTELFLEKFLTWADENKIYEFYIIVCQNLIYLYRSIKNLQKAMNVCEDMLMLMNELHLESEPVYADALVMVAAVYRESGEFDEAVGFYLSARPIYKTDTDKCRQDSGYLEMLIGLGECCSRTDKAEQGLRAYEEAVSFIAEHYGRNDAYRVVAGNCAVICDLLEDSEKASYYRKEMQYEKQE